MARQRQGSGFFGAATPGFPVPVPDVRTMATARPLHLPEQLRRDLARIGSGARRVADGDARAGVDAVSATLLRRATHGPNLEMAARIETIGYDAWLDEQLEYEAIDDSLLEDALKGALPTLTMSVGQIWSTYQDNPFPPVFELWAATLLRALYSPRQLYERMVTFWSDHFNIDIDADMQWLLKPVDDRDVVRAYALSSFPQLLSASAHSPAMLLYLTNDTNEKGHPNENYGRELMELHTLGANNGYDERDVKEVARCFTGWTWSNPYAPVGEPGSFRFDATIHDNRAKTVLGREIPPGGGIGDGERVVQILSNHRNTGAFIGRKMLRWLWGYEPTGAAVKAMQRAYQRSDGDIRTMLRTALKPSRMATATSKIKRPFHLYVSALRALGADLDNVGFVLEQLILSGHTPFGWSPPDGYPDRPEYWAGFVLPRWNFAATLFFEEASVSIDPAVDDPSGPPSQIVDRIDALITGGDMRPDTREQIERFLRKGRKTRRRVRDAIGLAIASPEFQEY